MVVAGGAVVEKGAKAHGPAFMFSAAARTQYAALAEMRWRMLVNSLRTKSGSFDLAARIFRSVFFLLIGIAAGTGLGVAAYGMTRDKQVQALLPLLFWPVMFLWQFIPVMVASFQEPVDLGLLLRFPVSFGSYMLEYLFYGLFDVSSILGGLCVTGIWAGVVVARPDMALWATLAAMGFAAFNLLLTRMIFAWLDRWLAQRKTREVLGMVFLFLILGLQFLNPAFYGHTDHEPRPSQENLTKIRQAAKTANRIQIVLPPGLAAGAIHNAESGHGLKALAMLGGLAFYGIAAGSLLGIRLRAQYRGESLGEAPSPALREKGAAAARRTFDLAGPVGAVVEKELRYLARSGVMLYSLVAPLIMLFIFGRPGTGGAEFFARYALPMGAAYGFLGLTRLVYNSLGGEGAGMQLYFMSPTPMRTVMLAKNVVQFGLFGAEFLIVCAIVVFRFGLPDPEMLAVTACWLLFALPAQLAAGNVLSITMAYRMTLTRMSREQGATGNGLLSLLIQLAVLGVGAGVYFPLAHAGHTRLAALVLLALAAAAVAAWLRVLSNVNEMAMQRREPLIERLARTG